jgi:hypothetical protein
MRQTLSTLAAVALSTALLACSDATTPVPQEDADLIASIAGATVDPNAETMGGHTATMPASGTSTTCVKSGTTVTCTGKSSGMDVTREVKFFDAAGNQQDKPDSSTRSMTSKATISGTMTVTGPNGATAKNTVNRASFETVTGLGPASAQRVVNGTASGTEDSEIKDAKGTTTVKRQYADTTKDLTLSSSISIMSPGPLSGKVIRHIKATITLNGGTPRSYTTREEQTYEAGGKLTVKSTTNGQTRTCVIQLGVKAPPVCTQG